MAKIEIIQNSFSPRQEGISLNGEGDSLGDVKQNVVAWEMDTAECNTQYCKHDRNQESFQCRLNDENQETTRQNNQNKTPAVENIWDKVNQIQVEQKNQNINETRCPSTQPTISERISDVEINSEGQFVSFEAITLKSKLEQGSSDSGEIQSMKRRFVKRQISCSQESIRSTTASTRPRRKCAGKPRDMGDFIAWPVKKSSNAPFKKQQRQKGSSLTFAILDLLRQQHCVPINNQRWMGQTPLLFNTDAPDIPLFKTASGSEPTCEQCVTKQQSSDDSSIEDQISIKTNADFKFHIQCLLK